LAVAPTDVVGLLFLWVVRVFHPFKPAISRNQRSASCPDVPEKLARCCRLDPRVDCRWALPSSPERLITPRQLCHPQPAVALKDNHHPRPWRYVVTVDRLRVDAALNRFVVPQRVEVFDRRPVLRKSSAHTPLLPAVE